MNTKVFVLIVLMVIFALAYGLVPSSIMGPELFHWFIPMSGACFGLVIAIPIFIIGKALSVGFTGRDYVILIAVATLAFGVTYFGNYMRDLMGMNGSTGSIGQLGPSMNGFVVYMKEILKETVVVDQLSGETKLKFGSLGSSLLLVANMLICGFFFTFITFLISLFFTYCPRCSCYKKKSENINILYSRSESGRFRDELAQLREIAGKGDYLKMIKRLKEQKIEQEKIFTPEIRRSKEFEKYPHYDLQITEVKCPVCLEANLKGYAWEYDAKGNCLKLSDMDFQLVSKPYESPSRLGVTA